MALPVRLNEKVAKSRARIIKIFTQFARALRFCGSRQPVSEGGNTTGEGKGNRDFNDIKVLKVVKVVKVANHSGRRTLFWFSALNDETANRHCETRAGLPFALEFAGGLTGYALEILSHERRIREIEFD